MFKRIFGGRWLLSVISLYIHSFSVHHKSDCHAKSQCFNSFLAEFLGWFRKVVRLHPILIHRFDY